MTICSRTKGYCFPYCFILFCNLKIPKQGIKMQIFFLNGLWRLLKNGHFPVKLHSSAPSGFACQDNLNNFGCCCIVFSENDPSTRQRYHYKIVFKSFHFGDRFQKLSLSVKTIIAKKVGGFDENGLKTFSCRQGFIHTKSYAVLKVV